jgi:hypothetical protein
MSLVVETETIRGFDMNAAQLFQDIETGALTEVVEAANTFYHEVRGLNARQQFFIYPDGLIYALTCCDASYEVVRLVDDNEAIFMHRYPQYFEQV